MTRFKFFRLQKSIYGYGGYQAPDRETDLGEPPATTIDGAVAQACELSKTHGTVIVRASGDGARPRGLAENGIWKWLDPCRHCKGAGDVANGTYVSKGKTYPRRETCKPCNGRGWRRAGEQAA